MLFVVNATDKPDSTALRASLRPHHLRYLADAGARVKLAGPVLNGTAEDAAAIGSMIIIDAASETAAKLFADNDPYTTGGLFETVTIKPFKEVTGSYLN